VYWWTYLRRRVALTDPVCSFKIKIDAADPRSAKYRTLLHQGINYLYRCEWSGRSHSSSPIIPIPI
jgi:hypothetical protein